MTFSSPIFLFVFLPATFLLYYSAPPARRNLVALLASIFFYGFGAPQVVPVLLVSVALDFFLSHKFDKSSSARFRKLIFSFTILSNLLLLIYFKYFNFFVRELQSLLGIDDSATLQLIEVSLPIGISFFTFQKISYLADVYSGRAEPAKSLSTYALYVVLFPQLIAGPILRYHDLAAQLIERSVNAKKTFCGIERFCLGLAKKVLIADALGELANQAFSLDPNLLTQGFAWIGLLCYAMQIYYDFSGYSDMAIGLGLMLGFKFTENFDRPYISRSITEFWRRWHITLSNWMRDYLYIPLGGNRCSKLRGVFNLWVVFILSGLWHGAQWNFVVWGVYHGFFLSMERYLSDSRIRLPSILSLPGTFLVVMFSWVFFRCDSLAHASHYFSRLIFTEVESAQPGLTGLDTVSSFHWSLLILTLAITFGPHSRIGSIFTPLTKSREIELPLIHLRFSIVLIGYFFSVLALASSHYHPFIYFRF